MAVGAPQPSSLAFFAKAFDESFSLTVFFADEDSSVLPAASSPPRVVVSDRTDLAVVGHISGQPRGMHARTKSCYRPSSLVSESCFSGAGWEAV